MIQVLSIGLAKKRSNALFFKLCFQNHLIFMLLGKLGTHLLCSSKLEELLYLIPYF